MEIREVNLVTGLTVDEGTHGVRDIGRVKNHRDAIFFLPTLETDSPKGRPALERHILSELKSLKKNHFMYVIEKIDSFVGWCMLCQL